MTDPTLRVAAAQVAPVLLDRAATLARAVARIDEAAAQGCALVAFGEALVPGYPVWLERTGGARFDAADQKQLHARYIEQAVRIEQGDLREVQEAARRGGIEVVLGTIERAPERGGVSLYCSLVHLGADGEPRSVHRKLMPTYEERLSWSPGDGAGLRVHDVGPFRVGSLNCWENWMPLARAALHAGGETLHIAIWPGGEHNTAPITRFLAREGRSYCISVSGLLRASDVPADFPQRELVAPDSNEVILNGGSCIAGPDGEWLIEPQVGEEGLFVAELDVRRVFEERQNFDPSGHYSRPDVLQLTVDRRRQRGARFIDEG